MHMMSRFFLIGAKNQSTVILAVYFLCYLLFLTIEPAFCMDTPPEPSSGKSTFNIFGMEYKFSWKPAPATPEAVADNVAKVCKEKLDAYKAIGEKPPGDLKTYCDKKVLEATKMAVDAHFPKK